MEYFFSKLNRIKQHISQVRYILLALDYDGTLTPIVPTPNQAVLDRKMRNLLISISKKEKFRLAIISGRKLKDIKKLVGIKGIFYAGNHGLEIEGPGLKFIHPACLKSSSYIQKIKSRFRHRLSRIEGILIEDKGLGLSLHYRNAKKSVIPEIKRVFKNIVSSYLKSKGIKISSGKMVLEVRPPVKWNKAMAVKLIKGNSFDRLRNCLTIYMGDDLTDEDVFRTMKDKDISIYVCEGSPRPKRSAARYFLKYHGQVKKILNMLAQI